MSDAAITTPTHNDHALDLRHLLRDATSSTHAQLDAQLSALNLDTLPGYRRFLEVNAAALFPLENALVDADVVRIFPDWHERSRHHALLRDLSDLGGVARPLAIQPRLSFGGILGTMYVLEGSRLGARVILQTIARSGSPAMIQATSYLRHGEGLRLWPRFLVALEQHTITTADATEAIEAARFAFSLFSQAAAQIPSLTHDTPNTERAVSG